MRPLKPGDVAKVVATGRRRRSRYALTDGIHAPDQGRHRVHTKVEGRLSGSASVCGELTRYELACRV